ncbi:hypothetical protein [Paractinoplanes brasiliensis]|uniref:Uncharacterized protein n=1 Tax=Paractinoplanes brasiliensis TaxID=52695 RepID=A0A4R6JSG1_9ACTN|nr:hypothetical protein [Actinoplanes brasiliensis]MDY7083979.1 hypothetical protein [Actinomycetota bacterium]TDO38351.1 hypothetical protein C8E87_2004 [Actinoplanes brasiliensis]GID26872.1 hypothetical protein Abr02nite_18550 [Actinoplanes brasiliensis]
MTGAGWFALAITIFGSLCYATASILQAVGARRSRGTAQTMAHPLYLAGIFFDILAWVGAIIALQQLAVYVVESILAGSLALTVLGARIWLGSRLRRRDSAAILVTIVSLTFLAFSAAPQHEVHTPGELRFALCGAAAAMVLVGYGAVKVDAPGGVIAACAGLSLGGAALVGRSLPIPAGASAGETGLILVTEPLTAALLVFAGTGMTLYAHALQHGDVGPVTAIHWTAEVMAPSIVAVAFLGDTVRDGWLLPAGIACACTVGAAIVLATAPATHATHVEAAEEPSKALPPQAPRHALGAPPLPVLPQPTGDRVIWWGPPPIWRPPDRGRPVEPSYRALALPAAAPRFVWAAPPSRRR